MKTIQPIKTVKFLPKPWGSETWLFEGNVDAPYLLKIIRAQKPLSVQVHPTDEYAEKNEKESGKTESWVVLETFGADPCLYLGFSRPLEKEAFRSFVDKPAEKFLPVLNKVSVRPGDVFDVPAGWIHAIGGGVVLLEIQQPSDLTYRIWDWGRTSRPLHIDKALDVLNFSALKPIRPRSKRTGTHEENLIRQPNAGYALDRLIFEKKGDEARLKESKRPFVLVVVKGSVGIGHQRFHRDSTILISARTSVSIQALDPSGAEVYKAFCDRS